MFGILDILSRWRIFGKPERKSPSDELSHRSACSTYPEQCQKTAPFVFDSVYSLLKQWPSNYAPNGHSAVPATVAPNTLLYHAQMTHGEPKNPVFFAFDAEMSLGIYGSTGTPTLHVMTTTKELRVLYLDGHSATLTKTGTLDSQIAILKGHVPAYPSEELIYNDHQRAVELCQLANQLNIDGIVRMNAGFEILVCDYHKSGVRELFVTNITVPGNESREDDPSLPRDPHRQPPLGYGNDFAEQNGWEWVRSSTSHYGNGAVGGIPENRVRLDICRIVSWYDPSLQSLNGSHRAGIRSNDTYENGWGLRRGHRLLEATANDIATFREWLSAATSGGKNSKCSQTNWQALIETIVDKYRSRAREILSNLEKDSSDAKAVHQIIHNIYTLTHAVLHPYLEYPVVGGVAKPEAKAKTLARCSASYTGHIQLDSLSEFEVLIKESTHIVVIKLCQWAWDLFEWTDGRTHNRLQQTAQASGRSQGDTRAIQQEIAGMFGRAVRISVDQM
ncbi:uncharacterized protein N7482_006519 [Penicillium canariense]|uniref:Uncharacterized protein n=1 Tax=Penicillium canariense TaxID=189055 RepID=A0A9W9LJ16_9EURO|nr:uncharacterized protein N7482_006519 [Penicillium canariense]KAJ5159515.1 hypothetical protein N7482_006519 [Penicillium canariense]